MAAPLSPPFRIASIESSRSPPMGGLRLDSIEAILKGGDSGAAIQPGEPEQSLLIKAVFYTDLRLKMPPKGKLSDEEIAALIEWVRMGSPAAGAAQPSSA